MPLRACADMPAPPQGEEEDVFDCLEAAEPAAAEEGAAAWPTDDIEAALAQVGASSPALTAAFRASWSSRRSAHDRAATARCP